MPVVARTHSVEVAQRRVREDQVRLDAQLAVVAALQSQGQSIAVAEMLVLAYRKFLKQSEKELAAAEAEHLSAEHV